MPSVKLTICKTQTPLLFQNLLNQSTVLLLVVPLPYLIRYVHQKSHTSQYPLRSLRFGLQLRREHIRWTTLSCFVNWARVYTGRRARGREVGFAVKHRHVEVHFSRFGLLQHSLVDVPPCTLKRQTRHERAITGARINLLRFLLGNVGLDVQFVQLPTVQLRRLLHDSGEEGLRVDETREPGHHRDLDRVRHPSLQLVDPHLQVSHPCSQTAERRPRQLSPFSGHRAVEQRHHERIHGIRDGKLTREPECEFLQRSDHLDNQLCHLFNLLQEDILERSFLLVQHAHHLGDVEVDVLNSLHNVIEHVFCQMLRATASASLFVVVVVSISRCQCADGVEELLGLQGTEVDLGVRVEPICNWGLFLQLFLSVFKVARVGGGCRALEGFFASVVKREQLHLIQQAVIHDEIEVSQTKYSIKIVHNMATIHDLTENIPQIFPRNARVVFLHVVIEAHGAVPQVTQREGIHHIETHRTEFLSLSHERVEVAQTEENRPNFSPKLIESRFRKSAERTLQVGLQTGGRLVGELDRTVKDSRRDAFGRV